MLEDCIDVESQKQNDYKINPEFSTELKNLNKQIEKIKLKINELKKDIEDDLDISKKINLVDSELYTYAFEVDKKDGDNGMRKSKNEYKILSVKNRVMVFTCPQLKELVNQYLELYDKYNEEQNKLVDKILEIVSTYHPLLEKISSIIARIDVLSAFAQISQQYQYVRPVISTEEMGKQEQIILIESRHPLIEVQDPSRCIPNNCVMVRENSNLQIITGPNMGGKSTYIR